MDTWETMLRYTLYLYPDTEQGGYWVTVPALPGCHSQGETLEEAIRKEREAIEGQIACLREAGEPIPEESEEGEHAQALVIDVAA